MIDRIPGGYYIKARIIKDKPVHKMPPYVREIWDYCLREANHSESNYGGNTVKRGQLFRTYKDIRKDLAWYVGYRKEMYNENHTKKAMKALREAFMITTSKELGGVLITVLNYDYYQDPKNYERTNEDTNESTTIEPSKNHPLPVNNKKKKNVNSSPIKKVPKKLKTNPPHSNEVQTFIDSLSEATKNLCKEKNIGQLKFKQLAETCFDHFRGKGEQKADWEATVRNWIRNDEKFNKKPNESDQQSKYKELD